MNMGKIEFENGSDEFIKSDATPFESKVNELKALAQKCVSHYHHVCDCGELKIVEMESQIADLEARLKEREWKVIGSGDLPNDGTYLVYLQSSNYECCAILQIYKNEWTNESGELLEGYWRPIKYMCLPVPFEKQNSIVNPSSYKTETGDR